MPRTEAVVLRLRALGESGQPSALPQRVHPISPPREYLVRVNLSKSEEGREIVRVDLSTRAEMERDWERWRKRGNICG